MEQSEPQEKIDFFLVSAHELRTSLSAMKWMFTMLLDGDFGQLNETQAAMIKQGAEANNRMIALINDTMTVIKTDGASVPYATLPVTLSALLEETIKDFTNEAKSKSMHLQYTAPGAPVIVIGDADKLRISIHNLIENAIKYGASHTDISVSLTVESGKAILRVSDKGEIIPEAEQASMFQKFFRASTVKDTLPGVGLGLYATKHIVERHGGTLGFKSSEGEGTMFILTLPLG